MDDFYKECLEKIQNTDDPAAAIDALSAITLHDLPRIQLCKLAEQATTLLSVIFQSGSDYPQDLTIKFRQIRQQLDTVLSFMERIMAVEKEFPSPQPGGNGCWW